MSTQNFNKPSKPCQQNKQVSILLDNFTISKYRSLINVAVYSPSSALFAAVKQAKKLLSQCHFFTKKISSFLQNKNIFMRVLQSKEISQLKENLITSKVKLNSWLDSFMSHFKFKYKFDVNKNNLSSVRVVTE